MSGRVFSIVCRRISLSTTKSEYDNNYNSQRNEDCDQPRSQVFPGLRLPITGAMQLAFLIMCLSS